MPSGCAFKITFLLLQLKYKAVSPARISSVKTDVSFTETAIVSLPTQPLASVTITE